MFVRFLASEDFEFGVSGKALVVSVSVRHSLLWAPCVLKLHP